MKNNKIYEWSWNFLLFSAHRWLLFVLFFGLDTIQKMLGENKNSKCRTVSAVLKIARKNHGILRTLEKFKTSHHALYYKKYLPMILISSYKNWEKGVVPLNGHEGKIAPVFAAISITGECNLRCQSCYAETLLGKKSLSPQVLKNRIDEFIQLGVKVFIILGGEPFVYSNLVEILGGFPHAFFFVFTNATLINQSIVATLRESPNIIPMLSLEGPEKITDLRRGKGVFAKVLSSHQLLSQNRILHGLSFTVTNQNINVITDESFLNQFDEKHLILLQFIQLMINGCGNLDCLGVTFEEKTQHNLKVQELRLIKDYAISNVPEDEIRLWGKCPAAGRGVVHILPDEQVQACIFSQKNVLDSTGLSIENVLNELKMESARVECCSSKCDYLVEIPRKQNEIDILSISSLK